MAIKSRNARQKIGAAGEPALQPDQFNAHLQGGDKFVALSPYENDPDVARQGRKLCAAVRVNLLSFRQRNRRVGKRRQIGDDVGRFGTLQARKHHFRTGNEGLGIGKEMPDIGE